MKFLLLDVYPKKPYRINKDQNGGYGTANNYGFGNSFISRILRKIVKDSVDFPPHYIVQTAGELIKNGYEVKYSRKILKNERKYNCYYRNTCCYRKYYRMFTLQ